MTPENVLEKASTTTLIKSDSSLDLRHLETGFSTLTREKPSFAASSLTAVNTSNADNCPQNHVCKKKDKGRVFPMKGFIKNLPTSISRSNKKKFLDAVPKDASADNPKEATDYPDIEVPQCENCKTLMDLLSVNEFTITELKNARQEDAEKFNAIENELKATIARLINASKENTLQNEDNKNLIQESQEIIFKENSNYISQIDSLVKQIEDLTLKLKILREKSEAQEAENVFLKNQIEMHKSNVKGFAKTRVMTLIEPARSSFIRTDIQEIYTKQSITAEASAQTSKATLARSRQSFTEHAALNNTAKKSNSSARKVLNESEPINAIDTPLENSNNLAISPELENEKKVSPEGNKPLDKEAPSIRSSKKKSAFKSLINKTSEIIKLSSQQAPVEHLQKRKELGSSNSLKDEDGEAPGTRNIQNSASLDHCSCTKRDSVKQNFSNVEKKSNKIYELKSNIVSCSQLRNARYSANGNDGLQKKNDETVHIQAGQHSNYTKNPSRPKNIPTECLITENNTLKKEVERIRKDSSLSVSLKDKLTPHNESLNKKSAKKLSKNYKNIGLSYSFLKHKKSLEHKNGQHKYHPPLSTSWTITRKTEQKKNTAAVKNSTTNEQLKAISDSSQPVTKTHKATKVRLHISPANVGGTVTPRHANVSIRRAQLEQNTQINRRSQGDTDSSSNESFVTNVTHSSIRRLHLHSTSAKERSDLQPFGVSSNRKNKLTYVLPSKRKNLRLTTRPLTKKKLASTLSILNRNNQAAFKVVQNVLLVNLVPANSVYHTFQDGTTSTDVICFVKEPFRKAFFELNILNKTKDNLEETVLFLQNVVKFIRKIYAAVFEVTKDEDLLLKEENLMVCVELFLSKAMLLYENSATTFSSHQRIEELQTFLILEREEHQEKITRLQRQLNKVQNELIQFKERMTYNPSVYCAASDLPLTKFMMHD